MRTHFLLSFAIAALALPSAAQQPAPSDVRTAFELKDGTIQRLQPQFTVDGVIRLDVELAGAQRTLVVAPYDVRTADCQFLVDDGNTITRVPAPENTLYRGSIAGDPESFVAAQYDDGQFTATLRVDGATWGVESLRSKMPDADRNAHVVYQRKDIDMPADVRCGNTEVGDGSAPVDGNNGINSVVLKETELALDLDFDFYQRKGSDVGSTMQAAFSVVNSVDAIYQRDVLITYKVSAVLVRTSRVYFQTNLSNLLGEFQNRWNANHTNIRRDVVHLFTGKGSFSGVIGIAYLSVICSQGSGYGISKAYASSAVTNAGLVAHELGHNWSAPHCNSSNPCNIMCSGLGGCSGSLTGFAPVSISQISGYRNGRGCLTNRDSGVAGSYTSVGFTGCVGTAGIVQHTAFGFARIGHSGYYRVTNVPANANTFLIFGLSDTNWNGLALPVDLVVIGAPTCLARIDHLVVLGGNAGAAGNRQVRYTYPNAPFFIGAELFSQYYVLDPGANTLGLTTSNAYKTTIGA